MLYSTERRGEGERYEGGEGNVTITDVIGIGVLGGFALAAGEVALYIAAFRMFGYGQRRPGLGKAVFVVFAAFWLAAGLMAVASPLGLGTAPDPWGGFFIAAALHAGLMAMTWGMVARDLRAALLVPFPCSGLIAALFLLAMV